MYIHHVNLKIKLVTDSCTKNRSPPLLMIIFLQAMVFSVKLNLEREIFSFSIAGKNFQQMKAVLGLENPNQKIKFFFTPSKENNFGKYAIFLHAHAV